ncbi:hypothetical protein HRbin25_00494 [bacterium HR25]|nr:hypothetical protein HRbin25_00494 [bacterium HR25]
MRSIPRWGMAAVALVLLAGGLSLLAFQAWGGESRQPLQPPGPADAVATMPPAPTPTPQQQPLALATRQAPVNHSPPVRIAIPSLGVDASAMTLGLDPQGVPYVPDWSNSQSPGTVVAWYNFTALPGQGSNAVFAGHVTWNRAPAIFWGLGTLAPGQTIHIFTGEGKELVYQVTENFTVDPDDPNSLRVMAPTDRDTITIITCGGSWVPDPNERFGGDYTLRVVVRGELTAVR